MDDNDDDQNKTSGQEQTAVNEDGSNSVTADEQVQVAASTEPDNTVYISHFRNEAHPVYVRYGLPFFMICTLALLINADIGSGVSAEYILLEDGEVVEQRELLVASIFSSVHELWLNESYPLAILIVITSIMWPYVKLFIAFYAWFRPYKVARRREFLVEVIDAFGKWSFVDIVVLVEIMVAFRSSIPLIEGVTLEIVIFAKWGFYGFVLATMMSLVSTHCILHMHRKVHYHSNTSTDAAAIEVEEKVGLKARAGLSNSFLGMAGIALLVSFVFYIVGTVVDIYQVQNTRGEVNIEVDYSVVSVGQAIPESQLDPNDVGIRFIQAMWFFLCVAMPLWCSFLFGLLFFYPFSKVWAERIFFMGEIAYAWSCGEVLLVSTIFSVLQMPTFGNGLIEADCSTCFIVDTEILPNFAFLCIGSCFNVAVNIWLYRKAHHILYGV